MFVIILCLSFSIICHFLLTVIKQCLPSIISWSFPLSFIPHCLTFAIVQQSVLIVCHSPTVCHLPIICHSPLSTIPHCLSYHPSWPVNQAGPLLLLSRSIISYFLLKQWAVVAMHHTNNIDTVLTPWMTVTCIIQAV